MSRSIWRVSMWESIEVITGGKGEGEDELIKGGNVWMVGNRQKSTTAPPLGYFTKRNFSSYFVCESRNVSLMEVIEEFMLCSTGQPLGFCGPLMKFNLGPSFLDVCQPSTHPQQGIYEAWADSVSLKPSLAIKAKNNNSGISFDNKAIIVQNERCVSSLFNFVRPIWYLIDTACTWVNKL